MQRLKTRRGIVAAIASVGLTSPFNIFAQTKPKAWRLGLLSVRSESALTDPNYIAFFDGLRELGYVEGQNLVVEKRFAGGHFERLDKLAMELVDLKVDVLAVVNVPVIRAAQKATKTIPIVMLASSDPVRSGFVQSLSRPGGNITGVSNLAADLAPKYVEVLQAAVPRLSCIAVFTNPANNAHLRHLEKIRAEAQAKKIKVVSAPIESETKIEAAFNAVGRDRADAFVLPVDAIFRDWWPLIRQLASERKLPGIVSDRSLVAAGALMSYGTDNPYAYRLAAKYIDRIFKGAKPTDLPVEQATKLEFVINRATAKALGISIPQELLLRADEVIG